MRVELRDPAFSAVADLFLEMNSATTACVHLSVVLDGVEVLSALTDAESAFDSGQPQDLQVLRSISKAVVALLAALAHHSGELDIDAPVADVWPEFACEGKDRITGRQLLSHTAGLPIFDRPVSVADALRWEPVVDLLARQRPIWEPGIAHGYHDLTFGWLVGEWLRRGCGLGVGQLVRQRLSEPLDIDLWIGMPLDHVERVRPLVRGSSATSRVFTPADKGSKDVGARVVDSSDVYGLHAFDSSLLESAVSNPSLHAIEGSVEYLTSEIPAANAVGDARSIALLFGALVRRSAPLLPPSSVRRLANVEAEGPDRVVGWYRRYGSGVMLPDPTRPMGGVDSGCFGHYGQGGALVFADFDTSLAFGYTTTEDCSFIGADPRNASLAAMALACAQGLA